MASPPTARRFQRRRNEWFVEMDLPSDITVKVDSDTFHLHKFPLLSRCGKLAHILETSEERQAKVACLELGSCPGGAESFVLAAKFCYGLHIELTAKNIFPVYCMAEHLGMTEDHGEENLLAKASVFFDRFVLRDWKCCLLSLQSSNLATETIDTLRMVDKVLCSLSVMASTDLSLFGWPMMMYGHRQSPSGSILWNGIPTGAAIRGQVSEWWFEDVSRLSTPLFCRLMWIMKERGTEPGDIYSAVVYYARKHIPGLDRWLFGSLDGRDAEKKSKVHSVDHKGMIEGLERVLPERKGKSECDFFLGLLRMGMVLGVGQTCKDSLERRIGEQLEFATLEGLMIPSFSGASDSLYDTDSVGRIIKHYLSVAPPSPSSRISKLVDRYLAEVASDYSLTPKKMRALSEIFPARLRPLQDGLYRALDIYLKAHPLLTTVEREGLLEVLDLSRLSAAAYMHASRNERLPMRVTLQVLHFEQLQLRTTFLSQEENEVREALPEGRWVSLVRESHSMRVDMDEMRARVRELEQEFVTMKQEVKKVVGRTSYGSPGSSKSPNVLLGCLHTTPRPGESPSKAFNSSRKSLAQLQRKHREKDLNNSSVGYRVYHSQ